MLTPDVLNKQLIQQVRDRLPQGTTVANYLMDILSLGKEAIYRRYRGEVPFTLAEAVIIARKLDISLDRLMGVKAPAEALLNLKQLKDKTPLENYMGMLDYYAGAFQAIAQKKPGVLWDASNRIVLGILLNYPALSRFHLFKWLYQQEAIVGESSIFGYEDVQLTEELRTRQKKLMDLSRLFPKSIYIWDNRAFTSVINDILYFRELQMISEENVEVLKSELLQMINDVDALAKRGQFPNGNELQMYLCHINFETSCVYVDAGNESIGLIKLYNMTTILSHDEGIVSNLKNWLQSLRKFSTLISQSAEMQRYKFFKEQKDQINLLLSSSNK